MRRDDVPSIDPPYGAFAPTPIQRTIIRVFHGTPLGYSRLRRVAVARFKSERPGPVDARLFGLKVRFHPHDNQTDAKAAVCGRCLNGSEQRWLRRALPKGGTFVDVGANMGFFSLFAARLGGSVIAVEPHPAMFGRLAVNMRLNGFAGALFNVAAGADTSDADLIPGDRDLGGSTIGGRGDGLQVPMRPLLDMVREAGATRIDVLKLDVEGYEDRVLVPFLATAPLSLWPKAIIMEHSSRQDWASDLLQVLTRDKGYVRRAANRANVLLSRSPRRRA
jgi:FkbM family methyltransferase